MFARYPHLKVFSTDLKNFCQEDEKVPPDSGYSDKKYVGRTTVLSASYKLLLKNQ